MSYSDIISDQFSNAIELIHCYSAIIYTVFFIHLFKMYIHYSNFVLRKHSKAKRSIISNASGLFVEKCRFTQSQAFYTYFTLKHQWHYRFGVNDMMLEILVSFW